VNFLSVFKLIIIYLSTKSKKKDLSIKLPQTF